MSARVKAVAAGIRRVYGTAVDQAAPITVAILRRMLEVAPPGLAGTRDQALFLTGFAGALRRSEIVALRGEDLAEVDEDRERRSETAVPMSAVPLHERPRERHFARGPEALTERELLAILLRNRTRGASAIELCAAATLVGLRFLG